MQSPLSVNEKMFLAQFQVISQIGKTNEGVIVGRCADYVLKDIPGVTNVFIHAEVEDRKKRAIEKYGEDPAKIDDIIATYDKARQNYYNYHTCQKWEITGTTTCRSTAAISQKRIGRTYR